MSLYKPFSVTHSISQTAAIYLRLLHIPQKVFMVPSGPWRHHHAFLALPGASLYPVGPCHWGRPSLYPDLEPSFSSAQGCQSLPEVHNHLVTSGLSTGPTCPVCCAGVLQEARAAQAPGLQSQPQLCSALPGTSTGDAESWTRKKHQKHSLERRHKRLQLTIN